MNDDTPPVVAAALRSSRFYFATKLGEYIPLLSVLGVRPVAKRKPGEKTDLVKGSRRTDYYATLPAGSMAVAIAGRGRGKFPGELILQPDEIKAFAAAIRNLPQ